MVLTCCCLATGVPYQSNLKIYGDNFLGYLLAESNYLLMLGMIGVEIKSGEIRIFRSESRVERSIEMQNVRPDFKT